MSTVAYVLLLVALIIFRQVYKGRVMNVGEDLTDAFVAFTTGDTAKLTEVLARTGEGNVATVSNLPSDAGVDTAGQGLVAAAIKAGTLAGSAIRRGKAAKGYRWTATGPDYYDCSGLMWRAAQDVGFTGVRFTTSTIQLSKQFQEVPPPGAQAPGRASATVNDIVVWPGHHMGVIVSPGRFYSARNPKSGIGEAAIEGFRSGPRKYYRLVVK